MLQKWLLIGLEDRKMLRERVEQRHLELAVSTICVSCLTK